MDNLKERSITVFYRPEKGAETGEVEKVTLKPGDKAGYFIHSDENGILGYRYFINEKTVLIPQIIVKKIEVIL